VRHWRDEAGALVIGDPKKMHVRDRQTYDDWTWRWRVYLPPGARYNVLASVNEPVLDTRLFPQRSDWGTILGHPKLSVISSTGEYDITITVAEAGGEYELAWEIAGDRLKTTNQTRFSRKELPWPEGNYESHWAAEFRDKTRVEGRDGENRLELVRHIARPLRSADAGGQVGGRGRAATSPPAQREYLGGLIVWIERIAPSDDE
jgi:hypothetical protein